MDNNLTIVNVIVFNIVNMMVILVLVYKKSGKGLNVVK